MLRSGRAVRDVALSHRSFQILPSLQLWASYAAKPSKSEKTDGGSSDPKIQRLLKLLQPQDVEEEPMSAEELKDAERRCEDSFHLLGHCSR
jgi:hypothetical protein